MPVAQTNPTSSQLMASAADNGLSIVTPKQQLACMVYAKAVQLKAANGTNYIGALNTLASDAVASTSGMRDSDVFAALVGITGDQANSDNSTDYPAAISSVLAQILLFSTRDIPTLERCNLLLEYLLMKRTGG